MTHWQTDIDGLLKIFRSSLLGVVPAMDEAHLAWRRPDSYDEWDSVAETLYRVLVLESIGWAEGLDESLPLPKYEMLYDTYEHMSFIDLAPKDRRTETLLFHAFGTSQDPFDLVMARPLSERGTPLSTELLTFPYAETSFRLRLRPPDAALNTLTELKINLR